MSGVPRVIVGVVTEGTVTGSLAVVQLNVPELMRPVTVRTIETPGVPLKEMFAVPCPDTIVPLVIDQSYESQPLVAAVVWLAQPGAPRVMTGFVAASSTRAMVVDAQPFVSVTVTVTSTGALPLGVKKV